MPPDAVQKYHRLRLLVHCVQVSGEGLDWVEVYSGVPQGTVLGRLLFHVYINDITRQINSNIKLFADDAVMNLEMF